MLQLNIGMLGGADRVVDKKFNDKQDIAQLHSSTPIRLIFTLVGVSDRSKSEIGKKNIFNFVQNIFVFSFVHKESGKTQLPLNQSSKK